MTDRKKRTTSLPVKKKENDYKPILTKKDQISNIIKKTKDKFSIKV